MIILDYTSLIKDSALIWFSSPLYFTLSTYANLLYFIYFTLLTLLFRPLSLFLHFFFYLCYFHSTPFYFYATFTLFFHDTPMVGNGHLLMSDLCITSSTVRHVRHVVVLIWFSMVYLLVSYYAVPASVRVAASGPSPPRHK